MVDINTDAKDFISKIKALRKKINCIKTKDGRVNSKKLISEIEEISSQYWFCDLREKLIGIYKFGENDEAIKKRDEAFKYLLDLTTIRGTKKKYLKNLDVVINKFQQEIVHPVLTKKVQIIPENEKTLNNLLDSVTSIIDEEQNEYISEAIACAKANFLKAAVILGWSACVDHIHKKIDNLGYDCFNTTSVKLTEQSTGKFKRFNKPYNISSINELRETSDKDILIILEGMALIDSNQGQRLRSSLEMRNHSAHPGEAPITRYNVMSFFSDIIEIILTNENFKC